MTIVFSERNVMFSAFIRVISPTSWCCGKYQLLVCLTFVRPHIITVVLRQASFIGMLDICQTAYNHERTHRRVSRQWAFYAWAEQFQCSSPVSIDPPTFFTPLPWPDVHHTWIHHRQISNLTAYHHRALLSVTFNLKCLTHVCLVRLVSTKIAFAIIIARSAAA